jgi:hypothetical protein
VLTVYGMVHVMLLPMINILYFYIITSHSAQYSFLCYYYLLSPLCKVLTITPGTNHVSTVYSFAAVLCLQFTAHVMLCPMINVFYLYISTSRRTCVAPVKTVFCSSFMSCSSGMLLVSLLLLLLFYCHR